MKRLNCEELETQEGCNASLYTGDIVPGQRALVSSTLSACMYAGSGDYIQSNFASIVAYTDGLTCSFTDADGCTLEKLSLWRMIEVYTQLLYP